MVRSGSKALIYLVMIIIQVTGKHGIVKVLMNRIHVYETSRLVMYIYSSIKSSGINL